MVQPETQRSQSAASPPSLRDAWRNALNPSLIQRLMRPATQPGLVRAYPTQAILARTQRLHDRLPLLATLTQRHGAGEVLQPQTAPIVYAQRSPSETSSLDTAAAPPVAAAVDLPIVQPKSLIAERFTIRPGPLGMDRAPTAHSDSTLESAAVTAVDSSGELPIVQPKPLTRVDSPASDSSHLKTEVHMIQLGSPKPLASEAITSQTSGAITTVGPPIIQRTPNAQFRKTAQPLGMTPFVSDKVSVIQAGTSEHESHWLNAPNQQRSPFVGGEQASLDSLQRSPMSESPTNKTASNPNQPPLELAAHHEIAMSEPSPSAAADLPVVQPQRIISVQENTIVPSTRLEQPDLQRSPTVQSEITSSASIEDPFQSHGTNYQKTDIGAPQPLPGLETPSPSSTSRLPPPGSATSGSSMQLKPIEQPFQSHGMNYQEADIGAPQPLPSLETLSPSSTSGLIPPESTTSGSSMQPKPIEQPFQSHGMNYQEADIGAPQPLPGLETPSPSSTSRLIPPEAATSASSTQLKPSPSATAPTLFSTDAEKTAQMAWPNPPPPSASISVQPHPVSRYLGPAIVRRSPRSPSKSGSHLPEPSSAVSQDMSIRDTSGTISEHTPDRSESTHLQRSSVLPSSLTVNSIPSSPPLNSPQAEPESARPVSPIPPPAAVSKPTATTAINLPTVQPTARTAGTFSQPGESEQAIASPILQTQLNPDHSNVQTETGDAGPHAAAAAETDAAFTVVQPMPIHSTWSQQPVSGGDGASTILTVQPKRAEQSEFGGRREPAANEIALSSRSFWVQRRPYPLTEGIASNREIAPHQPTINNPSLSIVEPFSLTAAPHGSDAAIQSRLAAQLQSANAGEEAAFPTSAEAEPTAQVDVDELVDKVLHKFTRQLAVERERRGGAQWS